GNGQASVAFTPPADTGGAAILASNGYTVTATPVGGGTPITTSGDASPITVTGLTNGVSYTFTVSATNAAGTSSASATSAALTPAAVPGAPTGVTGTVGNGQASVSFTPPADTGGAPILASNGYTVTATPVGGGTPITASGNASPITITGLANGTSYTFTVSATNAAGTSSASATSSALTPATVPGAPTGVTVTGGNGQASVAFTPPADTGGAPILGSNGYTVTATPVGGGTPITASGNASPITVTGLNNGTSYTFTVSAANAAGTSSASGVSSAVTPIATPTITTALTASAITYGQTLAASTLSGGVGSVAGSFAFTTPATAPAAGTAAQGVTFTPTDLVHYTTATTTVSVTVNKATPTITWAAPSTIVSGTALSATQLNATASVAGTFAYSPASGTTPAVGTQTLGVTFTPTNAANYTVATASVSLVVRPSGVVPSAPVITAVVLGYHEAIVHFIPPADDGGATITLYTVTATPAGLVPTSGTVRALATRGRDPQASTATIVVVTGTSSPITVTGLLDGTTYSFTVTANNSLGAGPPSAPSAPLTVAPPTRLSNLSVRIGAGTGDRTLIVGFVVGGAGTSGAKPLLVRGVGPTLASYGVTGTLADPSLALIPQGASTALATNDNWAGDAQLTSVGNAVGAFPLASAASKDAAFYLTPASGVYTVQVTGTGGTTGIALAEIYDASGTSYNITTPR
ncbi:MAG: fibronectin type III domain-containing protein, partial [Verrucomicrobiota bacterium]